MKKLSLLLFWILFSTVLSAQSIVVESFKHAENDVDAILEGTTVLDQNGEKCALIKVRSTPHANGFTFNVGQLGVMKVVDKETETWLYVPYGVRQISIFHPQLGRLDDYDLGMSVKKASTYILSLRVGRMQTIIEEEIARQYLQFKVEPADAFLEVNGKAWTLQDGVAYDLLDCGTYEYRVMAKDYHDEVGKVTLNSAGETKIVSVNLRPAFGWIQVNGSGDLVGAKVYVDNVLVGTIPTRTDRLSSGQHTLRVVQNMYADYIERVVVSDNQTVTITPTMEQNFANVTFKTMEGAEIWIDRERRGITSWTGRIEYGDHEIETKKTSHRSQKKVYSIASSTNGSTINLLQPIPIYGSLRVDVKPLGSSVYINGELKGETPYFSPKLLVGDYKIEVKKQAKSPLVKNITIEEKETFLISETLKEGLVSATLKSPISNVDIYLDGNHRFVNGMSLVDEFYLGEHEVIIAKLNYYQKTYKFEITHEGQIVELPMIEPIVGTLIVNTKPDGSDVYINGSRKGSTPFTTQLPIGNYKVKVDDIGYDEKVKDVTITTNPEGVTLGGRLKKTYYPPTINWPTVNLPDLPDYSDVLGDYYDNGGSKAIAAWRISASLGSYWDVEISSLSFRYKMVEFDLLNFDFVGDYNGIQCISYDPTFRLHFPVNEKWSIYAAVAPVFLFAGSDDYFDSYYTFDPEYYFKTDLGVRFDSGRYNYFDMFARYNYGAGIAVGVSWCMYLNLDEF